MSAAVMSNYRSQLQVEHWMLAQMSHYPPPPPPDQQHYSPLYPTSAGTPQLLDHSQQNQLQFSNLNQPAYPKIEPSTPAISNSPQIHDIAQELQKHAAQEEHQRQQIQHAAQRLQHQHQPQHQPQQFQPQQAPVQTDVSTDSQQPQKTNRLRKACDSCSIRKVKCDESGPPCRACAALDIPCTFERPSRRRGPPNRHAEAIKRRRLEESNGGGSISGTSTPSSPTHAAQALAALSSHPSNQQVSAESICPIETINLLINDFFTYIHPLCPFPHEPSFREAWKRREDLSNKSFLALLASMIGALVASFPRKPRQHLKAQGKENMFPNHMSLVHRCQSVCALARGPAYLESENLSVYDAATSYFLALMGVYTFRWRQGRLYFGECLTIIRTLGLHKGDSNQNNGSHLPSVVESRVGGQDGGREPPMDNITRQIGYRIFWTMFVSVRTVQQLGASFGELQIPPPTPTEPYPPLPDELDDFCIYPTHSDPQPHGLIPMIAGFNANVRVYSSYNPLTTMEMAWGIDAIVDWERQKKVLHESLRRCKGAISELPHELIVYPKATPLGQNGHSDGAQFLDGFAQNQDASTLLLNPNPNLPYGQEQTPEERRHMQFEIQKANIYASSLATRSYLVEKYWNLVEAHARSRSSQPPNSMPSSPGQGVTAAGIDGMLPQAPTSGYDMTEHEFREERETIVKDLLVVLSSIQQVNMEPNADSFTMKIRSIASTLLDMPEQRKGPLALQAQEYLHVFLNILMKLERVSPANSDPDAPEDEASELRHWADLREYQLKFAQQGGLLGFS